MGLKSSNGVNCQVENEIDHHEVMHQNFVLNSRQVSFTAQHCLEMFVSDL
jgi:hypothetical protein